MKLTLDLETRSEVNLLAQGAMRYAYHPSTEILLTAYAIDDDPPAFTTPTKLPALFEQADTIWITNAAFDVSVLEAKSIITPRHKLRDTMAVCAYNGISQGLDDAAQYLKLGGKQEDGKELIKLFCTPPFADPKDHPEKWERFKSYALRDVDLSRILSNLPRLPDVEQELWLETFELNRRGAPVDLKYVRRAHSLYQDLVTHGCKQVSTLTNGEIHSLKQAVKLAQWLTLPNVQKPTLRRMLLTEPPGPRTQIADLRLTCEGAAPAKFKKILDTQYGGRVYDSLCYHGATNSRWTGRGVQLQNLARPILNEETTFTLLDLGVPDINALISAVRYVFIAPEGCKLVICDLSQIEARVLAWFAKDNERLNVFASGVDVYVYSAAKMLGVAESAITDQTRMVGKVCELALGYQSGPNGLANFALDYNLAWDKSYCKTLVFAWRNANPLIVQMWYRMEDWVRQAYLNPNTRFGVVEYNDAIPCLYLHKPNGTKVTYMGFHIDRQNQFCYYSASHHMALTTTYGGSLVQTWVSSVARDILGYKWLLLRNKPIDILLSVHDELVGAVKEDHAEYARKAVEDMFREPVPWAAGLPINAKASVSSRYNK